MKSLNLFLSVSLLLGLTTLASIYKPLFDAPLSNQKVENLIYNLTNTSPNSTAQCQLTLTANKQKMDYQLVGTQIKSTPLPPDFYKELKTLKHVKYDLLCFEEDNLVFNAHDRLLFETIQPDNWLTSPAAYTLILALRIAWGYTLLPSASIDGRVNKFLVVECALGFAILLLEVPGLLYFKTKYPAKLYLSLLMLLYHIGSWYAMWHDEAYNKAKKIQIMEANDDTLDHCKTIASQMIQDTELSYLEYPSIIESLIEHSRIIEDADAPDAEFKRATINELQIQIQILRAAYDRERELHENAVQVEVQA